MRVCFVGDDVHAPWNNASSILTKRLIECISKKAKSYLATTITEHDHDPIYDTVKLVQAKSGSIRGLTSIRLSLATRGTGADIIHVVGTNALVFSPFCKLFGARGNIVRHVFTSYDNGDRAVRPIRTVANRLFIDGYAFTSPWIGEWAQDLSQKTRKFLIRPPINCDLYRPLPDRNDSDNDVDKSILYMGPLLKSRFPSQNVLRALGSLLAKGVKARLTVLTSAGRSSQAQCEEVSSEARSLGVDSHVMVKRVDLSEDDRIVAYNNADLVIFPYVGPIPEKLADPPFGLLEAMACGRPVLTSNVMSTSEIVDDGETGYLIANASAAEISRGVSRALTATDDDRVGASARARIVSRFSYAVVGEALLKTYASLIN